MNVILAADQRMVPPMVMAETLSFAPVASSKSLVGTMMVCGSSADGFLLVFFF